jgi:hypothetical protein
MRIHFSAVYPLFAAAVISGNALAQQSAVFGAPAMGYAFDREAHGLRPIRGVPGGATIGDPLDAGFRIDQAAVSSQQGYALAITGGAVRLVQFKSGLTATDLPVTGVARAVYVSPQGSAAAVLSDGWLGFVTGLTGSSPQIAGLAVNIQPVDAAISDDGAYLLAALADGSAAVFGKDGTRTSLAMPGPVSRVAFRPGSTDALAASTDDRVWLVQQTLIAPVISLIAQSADGIAGPVGLSFVPGTNRAVIANSGTGALHSVDVVSGARSTIPCSCKPVQLEAMASPGVFRLTTALTEPQYLFDGRSGQTFFVPALPSKTITERRPRN